MSDKADRVGAEGIRFFGKMSAAISHEIKNTLAIINENAGLLEDFSAMAEKGLPIDPGRLRHLAESIQKQIRRTDRVVRQMNRFAHSADDPVKSVDLIEIISLLVFLSDRFARLKGVVIGTRVAGAPVSVVTSPFVLENLIMRCLDFGMGAVGQRKNLRLSAETCEKGALIRLAGIEDMARDGLPPFPGAVENALACTLRAQLKLYTEKGEMVLVLPDNIHNEKGENDV